MTVSRSIKAGRTLGQSTCTAKEDTEQASVRSARQEPWQMSTTSPLSASRWSIPCMAPASSPGPAGTDSPRMYGGSCSSRPTSFDEADFRVLGVVQELFSSKRNFPDVSLAFLTVATRTVLTLHQLHHAKLLRPRPGYQAERNERQQHSCRQLFVLELSRIVGRARHKVAHGN